MKKNVDIRNSTTFWEGLPGKRGYIFQGGVQFLHKKQTKIWND